MSNLKRLYILFLASVLLVACNSLGAPSSPAPQSGIAGQVLVGPTCPVERPGQDCADKPYPATLTVLDRGGTQLAQLQAGADGRFRIALAPGTYTLVPEQPKGQPLPRAPEPLSVTVSAGEYVSVTMTYDSGIR